jgi:hypothetical protein
MLNCIKKGLFVLILSLCFFGCHEEQEPSKEPVPEEGFPKNLPPTPFVVRAESIENGNGEYIRFSWDESSDPEGGYINYTVYWLDQRIFSTRDIFTHYFNVNQFSANVIYTGEVVASDNAGNQTATKFSFSTRRPDAFPITLIYGGFNVAHLAWPKAKFSDESEAVYDILLNGNVLHENTSDTSILISSNHPAAQPSLDNRLLVYAKEPGSALRTTAAAHFQFNRRQLNANDLVLILYNVSDDEAAVVSYVRPGSPVYNVLLNQPIRIYIDGVLYGEANCGSSIEFPKLTGLSPNTTHVVRVEIETPQVPVDPAYEPVPPSLVTAKVSSFTTASTPISSEFDLNFTNITQTTADLSWRVKLAEISCSNRPTAAIKIHINGILRYTTSEVATSLKLQGLTPASTNTVKIQYTITINGVTSVQSEKETTVITL